MTETVLFVGGRMDGVRRKYASPREYIGLGVLEGKVFWIDGDNEATVKAEFYRREIIFCGDKQYPVYLAESEDRANLIPLLIAGYKGKE